MNRVCVECGVGVRISHQNVAGVRVGIGISRSINVKLRTISAALVRFWLNLVQLPSKHAVLCRVRLPSTRPLCSSRVPWCSLPDCFPSRVAIIPPPPVHVCVCARVYACVCTRACVRDSLQLGFGLQSSLARCGRVCFPRLPPFPVAIARFVMTHRTRLMFAKRLPT